MTHQNHDLDGLVTGEQACELMACKLSYWRRLVAEGKAPQPAIRQTKFTRWRRRDVVGFIEQLIAEAAK